MEIRKGIPKQRVRILLSVLILVLLILFWKRKEIAENKYTKAKLEIFKAFFEGDYEKAKAVLDTIQ